MSQVNDAKNAMSAMQKVNDAQKKLGLDESGRPPMCHVVVNCIVGIIFPAVGHWLARPDDVKSLSFFGVLAAQIAVYILGFIWDLLATLVQVVAAIYVVFVCLMSEKRQPYKKDTGSGAVDLER